MATVLERVPLERIEVEAEKIEFRRVVLGLFVGVFFALGWLVGRTWRCVAWSAAAVKVGFMAGRSGPAVPDGGG